MAAMEVAMLHSLFAITIVIGVVAYAPPSSAATDSVPKFNIERGCKLELSAGSVGNETVDSCKADEEQARNELIPRWTSFSPADKALCIKETQIDGSPSYVELETCLEMSPSGREKR
jgi:hypothetical protein